MQIRTKLGLVDIPNEVIMAAARDIAGSTDSTPVIAAPSGSLCTGDLVHRMGEIAAAAPFRDAQWNRTLQDATMALRETTALYRHPQLDRAVSPLEQFATQLAIA